MELTNIVAATAAASGYIAYVKEDRVGKMEEEEGFFSSTVVVVARNASDIGQLASQSSWRLLVPNAGTRPWTDDYSNVLAAIWYRYVGAKSQPRAATQ
jgi:hypothetical protein